MNAITSYFEALGMTPLQAASREALFEQLDRRAGPILDGPATWRRFTPGRIEIFGKHTDYAGGHSLLAAVPRGIALVARPRQDGIVRVGDIFDGQVIEVDPVTAAPPPGQTSAAAPRQPTRHPARRHPRRTAVRIGGTSCDPSRVPVTRPRGPPPRSRSSSCSW